MYLIKKLYICNVKQQQKHKTMEKEVKNYKYSNANGIEIELRTEKYGFAGFDIFVTVGAMGITDARGYVPMGHEDIIMTDTKYNNRPFGVRPTEDIMKQIVSDKKRPTTAKKEYDEKEAERERKEREFDNIYNEGAEGYNPYRKGQQGKKDNTPMYKED